MGNVVLAFPENFRPTLRYFLFANNIDTWEKFKQHPRDTIEQCPLLKDWQKREIKDWWDLDTKAAMSSAVLFACCPFPSNEEVAPRPRPETEETVNPRPRPETEETVNRHFAPPSPWMKGEQTVNPYLLQLRVQGE